MLESLLRSKQNISSGIIIDTLLNGQYRVTFNGRSSIATSQAGVLAVGQIVTIASTAAGSTIISAGAQTATSATEVTISG